MVFDVLSALGALGVLFIPGIFASFALLNGTKYSGFDKLVFGLILGLILVPLLSFTEYFLFSVKFNALLVLANSLLVLLVSFGIMHYQKQRLGFSFKFENKEWKRYAVLGLLTLFIVLTFYLRFSTAWSANFFEFDPFYYEKLTQRLVTDGFVSTWTGDSFYPHQAFQHWPPMVQYLTGSWFALHQLFSGQMFDKDTLILVSQLYPPIVAAMMCFLMFALIREEYNHYLALIPAALFAITPQLVTKLAAGVAEQQPWGLFTALLLLTLLVMALKQRSYRIALFAGLASLVSILGSQQYLWPAMVLAAFIGVQAILDYLSGSFEKKKTLVLLAVSAGFVLGNVIMALYQEQAYFRFDTPHVMFLASSFVFYALLHGISKQLKLQKFLHRLGALAVLFGLVAVGSLFTSLDDIILTTITSQAQIAVAGGALTKTIQEEAATNAGIFPSAFGVINPNLMILLATMLAVFTTAAFLASKKRFKSAAIVLGVSVVGIAFNPLVDAVLNALSSVVAYPPLQALFALVTASDVFTYMLITLAAASIIYLAKEEKNETPLLLVFIFFPIAFVGLSKVKYLVHLSLAIVIVFGYVLGQSLRVLEYFNDWLKFFSNPAHLRAGVIGILLFVGALTVTVQAQTIPNSLAQLEMTRIPLDWTETFKWMRANTPADSRVLSWWDYGHWTTFLGDRNTVLNPSNNYPSFDQGVAQAFVNGEDKDLYEIMEYHHATHVMVDWELVHKWGALVFLSGTCSSKESPVCPQTAAIPWEPGPGKSQYELEHYFEYLQVGGQCPASLSPVPLMLIQSGYGPIYCAGQDEYFLATQSGLNTSYSRKYKILGRDQLASVSSEFSYLVPWSDNKLLNLNPYLEPLGTKSSLLRSAFVRMFFFNEFPGFKLVHSSPNGLVKIFEYTGKPKGV